MTPPTSVDRPVETVERAVDILDYIKTKGPSGIPELTEEFDCAKSTIHRYLRTLESQSFLVREGDTYRLGVRFLDHGVVARERYDFFEEAKQKADELAEETEEKIWCTVEEHGQSVHIYGAQGRHSVRTSARVGRRTNLHSHAAGKSILAHLPQERIDAIIETHGLASRTPHTITDPDELREELATIREQGYALNFEESYEGLHAVGAPIIDEHGAVLGALSISGPAPRLTESYLRENLSARLVGTVNEIAINIAHL